MSISSQSSAEDFRSACCRRYGWRTEGFATAALARSFPPLARPVGALLLAFWPGLFAREIAVLERVGRAGDEAEVRGELDGYAFENHRDRPWRVRWLGLRISRRRLVRLFRATRKKDGPT